MKYSDCPTITAATTVDASAADVWALISDIALPAKYSNELKSAEWAGGASAGSVGAQFTGRNENAVIGSWETTSTVTRWEPNEVFEWSVGDPNHPSASWRFTITPLEAGVELEQWFQIGPGPSGLSPAIAAMPDKEERILLRRLEGQQANMQATLDAVKTRLER